MVVAKQQERAYGRMARTWASPRGGLWFSVVLRPELAPAAAALLPGGAALSVGEALADLCSLDWGFRWPNDIVVQTRKISGILGESRITGGKVQHVVLGIGLNANFSLNDLPPELRGSSTTLLHETNKKIDLARMLVAILARLQTKIEALFARKHVEIVDALREHDALRGKDLRLHTDHAILRGKGRGLSEEGKLRVQVTNGGVREFDSGEVQRVELDQSL